MWRHTIARFVSLYNDSPFSLYGADCTDTPNHACTNEWAPFCVPWPLSVWYCLARSQNYSLLISLSSLYVSLFVYVCVCMDMNIFNCFFFPMWHQVVLRWKKIVILIGHFHCAGPSKPTVATSTPSIYLSSCLFIHLSIQPSQTHTH